MSDSTPNAERIVELESVVAHLQHDLESFNSVLLKQQAEIDELQQMLSHLKTRLDQSEPAAESRDLEEERPPHY